MLTDKELETIAENVQGSCTIGGTPYEEILEREVSDAEISQINHYLANEGIHECECCGWYTFAGEGDGILCDDCIQDQEEE